MGERYFITGVQLGMIQAFLLTRSYDDIARMIGEVIDKQFITNTEGHDMEIIAVEKQEEKKMTSETERAKNNENWYNYGY